MEAPTLGDQNEAVLREHFGYSAERIAAGVLHRDEQSRAAVIAAVALKFGGGNRI